MRYFGSKFSTVESIYKLISEKIPSGTFCDPFGGIGVVGSYFKSKGYTVWSGDILTFPHYFQITRIEQNEEPLFATLSKALNCKSTEEIEYILNGSCARDGWLIEEYSEKRLFFTRANAKVIEACRSHIDQWSKYKLLNTNERAILLASLVNSMDKVANTAGTYYAYLKNWHRKALQSFRFEILPFTAGTTDCHCFLGEAKQLVEKRPYDILYLDPPYNDRRYADYYHLPETIALGETPKIHGKSGIPDVVRYSSVFNNQSKARDALVELLKKARFRLFVFHYSDDGLIAPSEVREILAPFGQLFEFTIDSKGYTTEKISRTVEHRIYVVQHG